MRLSALILAVVGSIPSAAFAQGDTADPAKLGDRLAGREVRVEESDRVIGTIRGVEGGLADRPRVVIELEEQGRAVAVDLDQLRQRGGNYYLEMPADEVAELPAHEAPAEEAPDDGGLPYGGVTPGWGGAPSGPSR